MAVFGIRKAQIGDPVVWYPDGNANMEGTPGVVVSTGEHAIDIVCHAANGGHILKQSVWHCDDRRLRENEFVRKAGGWDYAPHIKEMHELNRLLVQIQKNRENNAKRRQALRPDVNVDTRVDDEEEVVETANAGSDG